MKVFNKNIYNNHSLVQVGGGAALTLKSGTITNTNRAPSSSVLGTNPAKSGTARSGTGDSLADTNDTLTVQRRGR